MRSLGLVALAAIVSGIVAGVLQLQLAIWFHAQEEFIGVMFGQVLFILIAAGLFTVAVVIFETPRSVDRVAVGLAGVLLVGVVGVETFAITALNQSVTPGEMLRTDMPIILETVAPALLATLIQWWIIRRHAQKRQRLAAAA